VLGLGIHGPLDGKLHVGGLQLAPGVEAHPALEEERVVLLVGGVPALGQPGHELAVAVHLHQRFLHVVEDDAGGRGGGRGGDVETRRLGLALHDQPPRALGAGGDREQAAGERRDQRGEDRSARHSDLLKKSKVRRRPSSKGTTGV
jgi:hypothetical protein